MHASPPALGCVPFTPKGIAVKPGTAYRGFRNAWLATAVASNPVRPFPCLTRVSPGGFLPTLKGISVPRGAKEWRSVHWRGVELAGGVYSRGAVGPMAHSVRPGAVVTTSQKISRFTPKPNVTPKPSSTKKAIVSSDTMAPNRIDFVAISPMPSERF